MNLKDLEYKYGLNKTTIEAIVWLHSLLIYCFDAMLLLIPRKTGNTGRRRLLVIKLDAIGDFIIWLDFARGLRELYDAENYEITLLGNQAWVDFAAPIPWFDRILPVQRMKFILDPLYRFRTLLRIRRQGFEVLIDPTYSREFQFSPPVARVSGASRRLAPEGAGGNQRAWQKRISDRWYDQFFPSSTGPLMELQRNAEFLRSLGLRDFQARLPEYQPQVQSPVSPELPYYVLFPGASWVNRQWPLENFAAVADKIHAASGWRGVVCGGPGEESLARQLCAMSEAPLENLAGRTTLDELAALLAGAQFLVTNETSAVHLAAAVSTWAVCLLGGGHFGRFLPYQVEAGSAGRPMPTAVWHSLDCFDCNWQCVHPLSGDQAVPCIAKIGVDEVWETIRERYGFQDGGHRQKADSPE